MIGKETRTIKLNKEQLETLEHLLEYEIDQEYIYQANGDRDTEWLERLVNLYEQLYVGQARGFIEAFVYEDLVKTKRDLIKELKDEN